MDKEVRIDKWLWAARFYKTRNLANQAVEGGRVHVNNHRIKPSYKVKIDDTILISRQNVKQEIIVLGLNEQRKSAPEAQKLYRESEESIAQRELYVEQRKILNQGIPKTSGKPDKHQRRKLREISGKIIRKP